MTSHMHTHTHARTHMYTQLSYLCTLRYVIIKNTIYKNFTTQHQSILTSVNG